MDLGAIFFILAVLVLIGMYLYSPFITRARQADRGGEHELSSLMAERDRVITLLQELDFDFKLGKVPEDVYPVQRSELLKKGAEVLRRLDELEKSAAPGMDAAARLETVAAARRADAPVQMEAPVLSDDDIESLIAARRKSRKEKSAGFCPRCGQPVLVVDRFCPSCGKSLG